MRFSNTLLSAFALAVLAIPAGAQAGAKSKDKDKDRDDDTPRARVFRAEGFDDDGDRAVLGISTSSAGARDTLGLMITSITPGSPAEQAGLEEGNRIAAINGTSLKLAPADAGESDMNGIMTRRLTREMRKVKAGDDVELRIWQNGAYRTVKVKTIAAEDLPTRRVRFSREDMEDRPVIGVSVASTGSRRDTLGVMVNAVAEDGPAEKAGVYEGDRIASINGVDLRVSREDAGDDWVSNAKANRFNREMRKAKVGDDVELRVYSNGQFKTVKVKAARSGDVYKGQRSRAFFFGDAGEGFMVPPVPPMPPMPAIAPRVMVAPRVVMPRIPSGTIQLDMRGVNDAMERAMEAVRAARVQIDLDEPGAIHELDESDDAPEATPEPARAPAARVAPAPRATRAKVAAAPFAIQASWDGSAIPVLAATAGESSGALVAPGLRASRMSPDLAAYFGDRDVIGDGLLVIEADGRWDGLRVGDVIVAVNGQRVHGGDARSVRLDRRRDNVVDIVRKGRHETVRIPAA